MAKPKIMLLLDPSYGGFGDVTNLLRIGKFLVSKGYPVYSTVVFNGKDLEFIIETMGDIISILSENTIPSVMYCPPEKLQHFMHRNFIESIVHDDRYKNRWLKEANKIAIMKQIYKEFITARDIRVTYGVSIPVLKAIKEAVLLWEIEKETITSQRLIGILEKVNNLISRSAVNPTDIDYEILFYDAHAFFSGRTRILIGQHSDEHISEKTPLERKRSKIDFIISPVPPEKTEAVLQAGFHTHGTYTILPRSEVIKLLLRNPILTSLQEHLKHSAWGAYYSGTLGTNGFFFKRMLAALPRMLRKHGKITYFTFQDEKHFQKYVLRFLKGKPVGIIDVISNQIVQDYSDKDVLVINLQVSTDFMEAIIHCCTLFSVSAGDSSFNICLNNVNYNPSFAFFKYYNFNQKFFFQYLINTIHEFETAHNLGHDVSRAYFSFGWYEKLMYYKIPTDDYYENLKLFGLERRGNIFSILDKMSRKKEDFRLIQRMFYDEELIRKFNLIMRSLPAFIKERDNILSVEDVLLSILEGRIKPQ